MTEDGAARDKFNNKIEYFLTALSYAVGLGNVWRFPYLCYKNGGGSFLVPYLLSLLFLGWTFFFFESSIGQFTSLGPVKIWRLSPAFKGIGYAMFMMGAYVGIYYNMVIAWAMYYVYASFTKLPEVPWATCGNEWNTDSCLDLANQQNSIANKFNNSIHNKTMSPSQEFFYNQVLEMSNDIADMGSLRGHLVLCLALAWILIYLGLCLGAKSLGKVSYFTAIFPYVMITALLIKGVQLEGSDNGILHYISPKFEALTNIEVWADAATQIFYSLSICMGGVITLSSYNQFNNNLFKDSILIVVCNSLTSIYAGFAIFSVIGFMAAQIGKEVEDAADQGVGLAFVAYPAALARLPLSPFWSVIFFFMIITLGFGSQMTIVETVVSTLVDFWPTKLQKRKPIVLALVCFVLFLCGLPMCTGAGVYILQLMDTYSVPYSAFFIAIFEIIAIAWVYGLDKHMNNIYKMLGYHIKPQLYWRFMLKFGCPVIIIIMLLMVILKHNALVYNDYIFPVYTEYIGWAMTLSSVLMMPLFMLYELSNVIRGKKTLKDIFRPDVEFKNKPTDKIFDSSHDSKRILENGNGFEYKQGQINPAYLSTDCLSKGTVDEVQKVNKAQLLSYNSIDTWTGNGNSLNEANQPPPPPPPGFVINHSLNLTTNHSK